MRRRDTYISPPTPKRPRLRNRIVIGATVVSTVAALTGVTSVVATAEGRHWDHDWRGAMSWALPHVHRDAFTVSDVRHGHPVRTAGSRPSATPGATTTAPFTVPSAASAPTTPTSIPSITASSPTSSTSSPTATTPAPSVAGAASGSLTRLFSAASPWNTPIPAGAATDPNSGRIVSSVLDNPSLVMNLDLYAYGIPFYTATASTPRVVLGGRNPIGAIPIDPSWRPNNGADHKMNVLDPATHSVYELQGYDPSARSVYWAVKRDYATGLGDGYAPGGLAGPTGSGMTQAGGVIRMSEIKAGRIDHALSFLTSQPVAGFRYPASNSDGSGSGIGVQEGMRIQLDPSLNVDAIPGITPGEKAIAKALQKYGAYCTDNGGGNDQAMGFYVETPTPGEANPYPAAGFSNDWAQLPHIPRDKLRVVAASATPRPN